jgi:cobalt/nickel transport system ATP-binding protein
MVPLLADYVYVLNKGSIKLAGPTAMVFSQKKIIRDNNLRLPRVAHLVELLEKEGFETKTDLPMTIGQAKRRLQDRMNKP